MLAGTPHYIAPERALDAPADHRCDIYSLGIVAYEMFVGKLPFAGNSPVAVLLKHVNEPLPLPPEGLVPRALAEALQKAAAKDPADRWPTAGAFVSSLEVALGMAPANGEARTTGRGHDKGGRVSLGWIGAARGKINRRAFLRGLATIGTLSAVIGLTWLIARGPAPQPESPPLADQSGNVAPPIDAAAPATQPKPQPKASLDSRASVRTPSPVPPSVSAPAPSDPGRQRTRRSARSWSSPYLHVRSHCLTRRQRLRHHRSHRLATFPSQRPAPPSDVVTPPNYGGRSPLTIRLRQRSRARKAKWSCRRWWGWTAKFAMSPC